MSQINLPSRVLGSALFDVYVKAVSGDPPEGGLLDSASGGGGGSWSFAPGLRFVHAKYGAWPKSASASFQAVPLGGKLDPFELSLFGFGVDDQVRVVMVPGSAGTSIAPDPDPTGFEDTGLVVFEGTLVRTSFQARGASGDAGEDERAAVVAVDAPTMDNAHPDHLVRGRWYAEGVAGTPVLIDGLSVPSVFNAGGRPNRRAGVLVEADAGDLASVTANLFTADDDQAAMYWTLKEALGHLVVCWLYGIHTDYLGDAQGALPRSATLEPESYDALFGPTPIGDARWAGMDKLLPEADVQGLGVYDAIDRVCRLGGYRCAITPPMGRPPKDGATVDRLYQLRVWRAGAGPANAIRMANRNLVNDDASAADELADNNVSRLSGLRDASRIRNTVTVAGRTLIEVTVPLKPMWAPADVDGAAVGPRLQHKPVGQNGDSYHQKHVAGGKQFEQFGHVGRLWGLDETGAFHDAALGYPTGPYSHGVGGFDWLDFLEIDGTDALSTARTANGVTDPVRWARRRRKPMRLTRPASVAVGQAFRIDVSEDAGSTWFELPTGVATVVSDGFFGIALGVENLAAVSRTSFGADSKHGAAAEPDASWWALIASADLRFRLTCLVEADHAARFDAPLDAGSISRAPRAVRVDTRLVEVWQSPTSVLGDTTWAKLDDGGLVASASGADRTDNLRDLAERLRDERGQLRWSVSAEQWLMDPSLFAVGDTVTGVDGRNVDFGRFSAGSGETRYPSVVGVQLTGWPEQSQGLSIDIGDDTQRRGV